MSKAETVYRKLMEVPPGSVVSYSELARAVGMENGQRAVGRILNRNPYLIAVPCHRVIMADGRLGGYVGGSEVKANLLRKEGIVVKGDRVCDMDKIMYRFQ